MHKLFVLFLLPIYAYAGEESTMAPNITDPFARTDYVKAFHHEILKPFKDVLEYDGAIENIPFEFKENTRTLINTPQHNYIAVSNSLDNQKYNDRHKAMLEAVLKELYKCKRDAALRPVYEAGIITVLQGLCTGGLLAIMPVDSFGGGFGIFALMNLVGWVARDAGKSAYAYWKPGNDPYARWEKQFAERMPYIPHKLWPQITDTFGAARMGRYSYVRATEFFDIAFNLPTMHRYPYLSPLTEEQISEKCKAINNFTDRFFSDYQDGQTAAVSFKASVRKYLTKLATDQNGFVCSHLQGPGGVGKTHYIKALAQNITEVLEQEIPVEEINIRSNDSSELEGNKNTPGQVLSALSRIAKKKKPYGILVFDEASWLNSDLKEAAKKMFEPNLGSFKAQYLDSIDFSLKGFLIAFLSNEDIKDEALKSRMVLINFPKLKKSSLENMALKNLDKYLSGTGLQKKDVENDSAIQKVIESSNTMRDIENLLPTAIEEVLERNL